MEFPPLLTPRGVDKAEEERKPDANSFKVYSFARAIHAVMNLNHPIQSGADVLAVIHTIISPDNYSWTLSASRYWSKNHQSDQRALIQPIL